MSSRANGSFSLHMQLRVFLLLLLSQRCLFLSPCLAMLLLFFFFGRGRGLTFTLSFSVISCRSHCNLFPVSLKAFFSHSPLTTLHRKVEPRTYLKKEDKRERKKKNEWKRQTSTCGIYCWGIRA